MLLSLCPFESSPIVRFFTNHLVHLFPAYDTLESTFESSYSEWSFPNLDVDSSGDPTSATLDMFAASANSLPLVTHS